VSDLSFTSVGAEEKCCLVWQGSDWGCVKLSCSYYYVT